MIVRRVGPVRPNWQTPWDEFDSLRRDMRRLFELPSFTGGGVGVAGVFPTVNVTQDSDNYYLRADLPGVTHDNLDISAAYRTLTISGKRTTHQEEGVSYHRKERTESEFSRSVTLPSDFENERVEARLVNGRLTVTLPKPEAQKPRQISVSVH